MIPGVIAWRRQSDGLGPERVANGKFVDASGWSNTTGAMFSISGGVANAASGTSGIFANAGTVEAGKTYRVTYDLVRTAGSVRINFTAANFGTVRSASGTYTEDITAVAGTTIEANGFGSFRGSIDNVSVREVLAP